MQLFVKHQLSDVEGYPPPSGQCRDYQKSRKRCKISSRSLEAKHFIGGGREAGNRHQGVLFGRFFYVLPPRHFASYLLHFIPFIKHPLHRWNHHLFHALWFCMFCTFSPSFAPHWVAAVLVYRFTFQLSFLLLLHSTSFPTLLSLSMRRPASVLSSISLFSIAIGGGGG